MTSPPQAKDPLVPVSRFLAVIALVVFAFGLVQLSGVVKLPFLDWLCSPTGSVLSTGTLSDLMRNYGYLSLFILMVAESASVPIPSEVILPIAGFLAFEGALSSLPLVFAVSTAGALVGALLDYYLARLLGRPFVGAVLRAFRLDPADLDRAERWFDRSGQWTVFAARFVPLVRALISLPAGLFRMRIVPFVAMTLVGCAIWNGVLLYAGFVAGSYLNSVCASSAGAIVIDGLTAAVVATAAAYLAYFLVKSRRSKVPASPDA